MPEHRDHELREAQLRFIGKILATLSHELKNHLAIIKEYSGLIQDLAEAEKPPTAGSAGQYVSSARSIHLQIDKTLVLLRAFSRFSHRMDASQSVYSVNEAVEELLALIHRLANQRQIHIEQAFHQDLPQVNGNPALLQFSLFHLIEDSMCRLERNGTLLLKTGPAKGAVTISLISQGRLREDDKKRLECTDEALDEALRHFGGKSSRTATGEEATLTIPLADHASLAEKK